MKIHIREDSTLCYVQDDKSEKQTRMYKYSAIVPFSSVLFSRLFEYHEKSLSR